MYFRDPAWVISLFQDTIPLTFDSSGVKYAGRNTKGLHVYRTRLESIQLTPKGEGVELYRSGYRNQVGLILVVHYHGTKLPGPTCCRGHWPGHHKNRPRHGLESSRRDWFLHRRLIPISAVASENSKRDTRSVRCLVFRLSAHYSRTEKEGEKI